MIKKDRIKNILFITLSNIGDVVLTTPVIKLLKEEFPKIKLSVMVGPRAREVFDKDPEIFELIVYDKSISFINKMKLVLELRRKKYDMVIDLRNSIFPYVLGAKYRTSSILKPPHTLRHKRDVHLWKLNSCGLKFNSLPPQPFIWFSKHDEDFINRLLESYGILNSKRLVAISPGARSNLKMWKIDGFAALSDKLTDRYNATVIMVGDSADMSVIENVASKTKNKFINLSGRTTLKQLASLFKRCNLVIANDSAPMHIAVSVGTPVVAIFGPTDSAKYGPTGDKDIVVKRNLSCSPCEEAHCKRNRECIELIEVDEVFEAAKGILERSL